MKIRSILLSLFKYIYINIFTPPIINKKDKLIYISYLSEPFKKKNDSTYLNKHQNRRETILLGEILSNLGWGYVVERFDKYLVKNGKYQAIFGLEPNFERMAKKNPDAVKIYYATGSYYQHQNKMIIQRTDEFNKKHHTELSYQRLVKPHNSCETADYIFQIGSSKTINTYPPELRNKIHIIRQTCHTFINYDVQDKLKYYDRKQFVWMGSNGSILKGLDLVLDYFIGHKEFTLHVIGNIDHDFYSVYKNQINSSTNIHYHGFMDMNDPHFIKIAYQCSCIIFPSCSEGMPGSVINMMKLGLIPIVAKWCSFDKIDVLGYELKDLTTTSIEQSILWFNSLSNKEVEELFIQNHKYSTETYNKNVFEKDMTTNFKKVLPKC